MGKADSAAGRFIAAIKFWPIRVSLIIDEIREQGDCMWPDRT